MISWVKNSWMVGWLIYFLIYFDRILGRRLCTLLYGPQTRTRCRWSISLCKTGTVALFTASHSYMMKRSTENGKKNKKHKAREHHLMCVCVCIQWLSGQADRRREHCAPLLLHLREAGVCETVTQGQAADWYRSVIHYTFNDACIRLVETGALIHSLNGFVISVNQNGETSLDIARRLKNTHCEEPVSVQTECI